MQLTRVFARAMVATAIQYKRYDMYHYLNIMFMSHTSKCTVVVQHIRTERWTKKLQSPGRETVGSKRDRGRERGGEAEGKNAR